MKTIKMIIQASLIFTALFVAFVMYLIHGLPEWMDLVVGLVCVPTGLYLAYSGIREEMK